MNRYYIHLISLLMLSPIVGENFSKSSFPGGYLSIGLQIGKRLSKGDSFIYFDFNLNFWNVLFTLGTGRGVFLDKDKKYPRNKYWGGLGFIPIILCTDNYFINDNKQKQIGIMTTLPLPIFGNNFYP